MKPEINGTSFGCIVIDGKSYNHDVIIRLDGKVKKRKKKLSKSVYGTSHRISLEEAEHIFENRAKVLIVGTGQRGCVELSAEAAEFFHRTGCSVKLFSTPEAVTAWNSAEGAVIGMFHVTC
jgi:hypothetical protein